MLRPTLLFGAVITGIGYLQFFEEAFVMTKGGPLDSTRSVTYFTFDQFGFGNYGYAAAASYLLFLAVVLLTWVQFRWLGETRGEVMTMIETQPPEQARKAPASREGGAWRRTPSLAVRRPARSGCSWSSCPFVWMLVSSLKPEAEVRAVPPTWWPETITLDNYDTLFTKLDFPTYFMNSAIVALAVTAGNMVFCSMLGYALAKLDFPGKKALFAIVLGTLMIPGVVTFVPLFVLTTKIGLSNTLIGMILPFLAGPFGVFLMRQFIQSLPDELIQAARIDGAGELRIFFSVILPLCGPALATLGILTFLTSWNNFLWPLVVAQTEDKYTLPVALALYAVGPERHPVRAPARRLRRRRAPRARRLPAPAAPHHAGHRDDRHQVNPHHTPLPGRRHHHENPIHARPRVDSRRRGRRTRATDRAVGHR